MDWKFKQQFVLYLFICHRYKTQTVTLHVELYKWIEAIILFLTSMILDITIDIIKIKIKLDLTQNCNCCSGQSVNKSRI